MKDRDAWEVSYRVAMAKERSLAEDAVDAAKRRLDIVTGDPKTDVGSVYTAWINVRTMTAMHQAIVDLEGDSSDFLSILESSALGSTGRMN